MIALKSEFAQVEDCGLLKGLSLGSSRKISKKVEWNEKKGRRRKTRKVTKTINLSLSCERKQLGREEEKGSLLNKKSLFFSSLLFLSC